MLRYEFRPPLVTNVATLPWESRNTENVILQWDITNGNCIQMYHSFIEKGSCALHLLIWAIMQQRMYETNNIDDLWKRLMQTWFDFKQDVIDSTIGQWDHVCVLMADTMNTCSEVNDHLYDLSEHFVKLSVSFEAFNGYFVISVKSWVCVYLHFRCFNFQTVV